MSGFYLFILFLFLAALDLSCGLRDIRWGMWDHSLQHAGFSLVVVCGFSLL